MIIKLTDQKIVPGFTRKEYHKSTILQKYPNAKYIGSIIWLSALPPVDFYYYLTINEIRILYHYNRNITEWREVILNKKTYHNDILHCGFTKEFIPYITKVAEFVIRISQ